jgi:hypothetical protein
VPASADDRRILVLATVAVAGASLAVMALLFFATGGGGETPTQREPLFLGLEQEKVSDIAKEGPQYIANPFGDNGFWLDLEDGELVALDLVKPGTANCQVKWKDPRQAYVDDCDDEELQSVDLDRYEVIVGKIGEGDAPEDGVYVDLRVQEPAPGSTETTG